MKEVRIVKRIITLAGLCLASFVFFTGCSSESMEMVMETSATEPSTDENGETLPLISIEKTEVPDYFEYNLMEKFIDGQGKQAFHIKDGHSRDPKDIEDFQVKAMKDDKTFVYGYVTRVADGAGDGGNMVHCGAIYNYDTEDFLVFHENVFAREGEDPEDEESFFIQAEDGGGDIFVYDNGDGYIYDSDGNQKFHGNIEGFLRRQFENVYSVSVMNALTDGQNRIYMELSVEKEEIQVPLEGNPEEADLDNEKDLDKEAEELDKEVEKKTEVLILVYEYQKVNSGMDQKNDAFEEQKKAWIAMTEGEEFATRPGGVEDWNKVVEEYPDAWGSAYLGSMGNANVYQWKDEEKFVEKDGVSTFKPEPDTYVNFRDVKENWQLEKLFIPIDKNYSYLYGRTKTFRYYNPESLERTYTLVWYEDETAEDGTTVQVKRSQGYTQRLHNIYTKRYVPLENAYVETYRVMDQEKAVTLGRRVDGQIQCTGKDGKVRWILPDGKLADTPYKVTEDTQAGAFSENGQVYYLEYGQEAMAIVPDASRGGDKKATPEKIEYKTLAGGFEAGDSAYDAILENQMEEDVPSLSGMYGHDYYTEDQVLHAELNLDLSLAHKLRMKGDQGISLLGTVWPKGFLLTSREKGLVFYAPATKQSAVLEGGAWYRSWKKGDRFISVGFLNGEASYTGSDIAFARVYEYNLSQLCNEGMRKTLEDIEKAEAQEKAEREAEESRKAAESGGEETTKSPVDEWDEGYKKKYEETYPKD